jgi:anti-sigma factor RsiW
VSTPVTPSCADPIDVAVLMDYWRAALDSAQEEAVEAHLFTCDACGDRLRQLIALADSLRDLARSGTLRVILGTGFAPHVTREGRQVRQYGQRGLSGVDRLREDGAEQFDADASAGHRRGGR